MCVDKCRMVLKWLTAAGWLVTIPLAGMVATRPDHPARVLVILFGVTVVGVTMLWVQVSLLGDHLRAYMLGVQDTLAGLDPEPGKPAEVVKIRRVS